MENKEFLLKADKAKKDLIEETIVLNGDNRILKDEDEIIFDFKNHYVGYLSLDISSVGHHQDAPLYFSIQFAEIEAELNQNIDEYKGWISKSWIQEEKIHIDVLPCTYTLERRYAFRYVKIKVINTSNNYSIKIDKLTARTVSSADYKNVTYPNFNEKDKRLDEVSLRTLHSCMQDVFEDGPKRDRRLWLGDLRLEALANYYTFKNYNLVKRCLYLFAGSTLEEGRLANNVFTTPKVECDYQTMFDYTIFFINTLWNYYEATSDLETLKELEAVAYRQYELLKECFDDNDEINLDKAGNVFVDWNFDLDKKASGQAIYIYGLKDLIQIEKTLNKDTSLIEEEVKKKSEAALKMFDEKSGRFLSNKQVSYMSQVWMILAKVVDEELGKKILSKLDSEKDVVKLNSPYAYHHYIQALIDVGMKDEAYRKMHEYWGKMIEKGTDTFWEIFNPDNPDVSPYGGLVVHSFCHAWSCTPTYFLRKYFYK